MYPRIPAASKRHHLTYHRSMRLPSQTLLIDADDTLWENNIYFERAIANFISFLNHQEFSTEQVREVLNDVERDMVFKALGETGGRQDRAAELLGISRRTLLRKLKVYRSEAGDTAALSGCKAS